MVKHVLVGFVIGIANLIPGVSGGTFALIFGVYERLIKFINSLNGQSMKALMALVVTWVKSGFKKEAGSELIGYLKVHDYPFMGWIFLGIALSIITLSKLMKWLLLNHFEYTYAYFFGLILLSVIIPFKIIRHRGAPQYMFMVVGAALTIAVTAMVNPADKVVAKSELLQKQYTVEQSDSQLVDEVNVEKSFISLSGKYSSGEYIYIFVCGAIAISAMVLPGVSGSLVLILMGQYFTVISALALFISALTKGEVLADEFLLLAAMGIGIVIGLLGFSRFIEFALNRFHDSMVSFLVGLIGGSLYALWPFKKSLVIDNYIKSGKGVEVVKDYTVYTNINIVPEDTAVIVFSILFVALGLLTMYFFVKKEVSES